MAEVETGEVRSPVRDPEKMTEPSLLDGKALDHKLTEAAERTRARYAAGQALNADGSVKTDAILSRLRELMPTPSGESVGAGQRIPLEEGDEPALSSERKSLIVPARFESTSFENYRAETPSQKTALAAVGRWVTHAKHRSGLMLALIGSTGIGKSHLLYAAANALLAAGFGVYARGWYRLADELRYGGESPLALSRDMKPYALEASEVRALLWRQKIVLLDEVRPTAATAFDDTELAKYACHAYDAKLSVLITTNVHPLADVMGPPAASRFTQLVVDGEDRRQA